MKSNQSPEKQEFMTNDNNEEYNEEIENDLYLLALQKRLWQMKKDRQKADQDAQLLNNRLNLLKGEEDKVIAIINII